MFREARERVKRLLEQDRLDKKTQRDAEIKERENVREVKLKERNETDEKEKAQAEEKRKEQCRLQVCC